MTDPIGEVAIDAIHGNPFYQKSDIILLVENCLCEYERCGLPSLTINIENYRVSPVLQYLPRLSIKGPILANTISAHHYNLFY